MRVWRAAFILALVGLVPAMAAAGPAGKVIIAQGADPSTLDVMNQLETPVFNVGSQIFETLLARDESLRPIRRWRRSCPGRSRRPCWRSPSGGACASTTEGR